VKPKIPTPEPSTNHRTPPGTLTRELRPTGRELYKRLRLPATRADDLDRPGEEGSEDSNNKKKGGKEEIQDRAGRRRGREEPPAWSGAGGYRGKKRRHGGRASKNTRGACFTKKRKGLEVKMGGRENLIKQGRTGVGFQRKRHGSQMTSSHPPDPDPKEQPNRKGLQGKKRRARFHWYLLRKRGLAGWGGRIVGRDTRRGGSGAVEGHSRNGTKKRPAPTGVAPATGSAYSNRLERGISSAREVPQGRLRAVRVACQRSQAQAPTPGKPERPLPASKDSHSAGPRSLLFPLPFSLLPWGVGGGRA